MTSPLAVQVMRFAFLILLWLFIYALVRAIRSELRASGAPRVQSVGKPRRSKRNASSDGRAAVAKPRGGLSQLVVVEGSLAGTRVALTGKPIFIGRANDSTLVLTDDYASTRHARISESSGTWYLEDLGSTNGTFVGQQKVDGPVSLEAGVPIQIGKTVMELR
ncbi:FHA domain-containing protein [Jatrophihabitans telluris]|uniref:FHA domain-containing protein n=1 Tax=Jatrophihabitans telluris TaxID=2038343 RepID=A0ABY4QYL6_9ACTN|nr:FHA domain-containing protein [Jatrophihabitans telluris]UQX88628.1 FHA domain-containing protein [Jatrophihabitans telluris]